MRRLLTLCLVAAMGLAGCTDDGGEDASPSEPPSGSETEVVSESEEPSESEDPSASPSPTETESEPDDGASEDEASEGEASEGEDDDVEAAPSPSPSASPTGPVTPATSTAASIDASGSVFASDATRTRQRVSGGDCPVVPADGEEIVACTMGFSRSNDDRQTAVVASRIDGVETITVYDAGDSGSWQSSLVASDVGDDLESIRRAPWAGSDDAFVIDFPSAQELVVTDAASGSRVVAVIGDGLAGRSIDYVAGRVLIRTTELGSVELQVLEPTSSGLVGTTLRPVEGEQIAESTALRVYEAWVSGSPASAADHATPEVVAALEAAPQGADAFTLVGTTCPVEAGVAICRFRGDGAELTWEVRSVDGSLKVTRLR